MQTTWHNWLLPPRPIKSLPPLSLSSFRTALALQSAARRCWKRRQALWCSVLSAWTTTWTRSVLVWGSGRSWRGHKNSSTPEAASEINEPPTGSYYLSASYWSLSLLQFHPVLFCFFYRLAHFNFCLEVDILRPRPLTVVLLWLALVLFYFPRSDKTYFYRWVKYDDDFSLQRWLATSSESLIYYLRFTKNIHNSCVHCLWPCSIMSCMFQQK